MCNSSFFHEILSAKPIYGIILLIQGHLLKTKWAPDMSRSNIIFQQMKLGTNVIPGTSFSFDLDWAIHFLY